MPEVTPDKRLFTPGPLTTSPTVKQAMLHDLGSRDATFIALVRRIRERLLALGSVSQADGYEAIPMQGSGTFGVEATLSSVVPATGKLLVLINGAYGERMAKMAAIHRIPCQTLRCPEDQTHSLTEVERTLTEDKTITHVAFVHCETTTGILNPIEAVGAIVARHGREYIVDAMSSFGAIPVEMRACSIHYLISSANKCIEGVPGFAFVLALREALLRTEGVARTLSLDLLAQWRGLEKDGQFRFTPPIQALLAFDQALNELEAEGGVAGRGARYRANQAALLQGMRTLGFREYLPAEQQSPIITTFHYPAHPRFHFETFYERLSEHGMVIYPGKLTQAECFRIGTVGRLAEADIQALLTAIRAVLQEMGFGESIKEQR